MPDDIPGGERTVNQDARAQPMTEQELHQIGSAIQYAMDDPNSEFCRMQKLVEGCCDRLGIDWEDKKRGIIGDHILRGIWLGQGDWKPPEPADEPAPESNVVPIRPGLVPKALNRKPNPKTIKLLEDALKKAREGEVTAVVMVLGFHDFAVQGVFGGVGRAAAMVGEMEFIKQEIIQDYNDGRLDFDNGTPEPA